MTRNELVTKLKSSESLLPKDILEDTDINTLVVDLRSIYNSHKDEMSSNEQFLSNFTEVVNFVYLRALTQQKMNKRKEIFSTNIINFLINSNATV